MLEVIDELVLIQVNVAFAGQADSKGKVRISERQDDGLQSGQTALGPVPRADDTAGLEPETTRTRAVCKRQLAGVLEAADKPDQPLETEIFDGPAQHNVAIRYDGWRHHEYRHTVCSTWHKPDRRRVDHAPFASRLRRSARTITGDRWPSSRPAYATAGRATIHPPTCARDTSPSLPRMF